MGVFEKIAATPVHELPTKVLRWLWRNARDVIEEWWARAGGLEVKPSELPRLVEGHPLSPYDAAVKVLEGMSSSVRIDSKLLESLKEQVPEEVAELIREADRLCSGHFRILGEDVHYSSNIDWHVDPRHNHRFDPGAFHKRIPHSNPAGGCDIKYPWELSRLQHLPRLALAFRVAGEARYLDSLKRQTIDWIRQNPLGFGPNWACTMDVSIRAANLAYAVALSGSHTWEGEAGIELVRTLVAHGRFIVANLEWSEALTSNHYLADIAGLAVLASLLASGIPEARGWLHFARNELAAEIEKQVYPDGWDFEASTSYHRLALECFLVATIFLERSGLLFDDRYRERLRAMAQFARDITLPDGSFPLIGDNDSGRFMVLHPSRAENMNHLLGLCAAYPDEPSLSPQAPSASLEIPWLLGWRDLDRLGAPAPTARPTLAAFPDGGLWCLRSEDGLDLLTFRLGPVGQNGNGGHAHNDQLSVTIWFGGKPIVVDPGTACYTSDPEKRNLFRSARMHATIILGQEEQNRFVEGTLFRLPQQVKTTPAQVEENDNSVTMIGVMTGYGGWSDDEVRITRLIRHDRHRRQFEIQDEIELARHLGSAPVVWHFPLAPGIDIDLGGPGQGAIVAEDGSIASELLFLPGWKLELIPGSYSPGYGEEVPNRIMAFAPPPGTLKSHFIFRAGGDQE